MVNVTGFANPPPVALKVYGGPPTMALSGGATPKVIVCEPRSLSWTLIVDPAAGATTWAQGASCEPDGGVTVIMSAPSVAAWIGPPRAIRRLGGTLVPEAVPPKRGNEVGAHGRSTLLPYWRTRGVSDRDGHRLGRQLESALYPRCQVDPGYGHGEGRGIPERPGNPHAIIAGGTVRAKPPAAAVVVSATSVPPSVEMAMVWLPSWPSHESKRTP